MFPNLILLMSGLMGYLCKKNIQLKRYQTISTCGVISIQVTLWISGFRLEYSYLALEAVSTFNEFRDSEVDLSYPLPPTNYLRYQIHYCSIVLPTVLTGLWKKLTTMVFDVWTLVSLDPSKTLMHIGARFLTVSEPRIWPWRWWLCFPLTRSAPLAMPLRLRFGGWRKRWKGLCIPEFKAPLSTKVLKY